MPSFILKATLIDAPTPSALRIREGAYLVCEDGVCRGVFDALPAEYARLPVTDCGDRLVIPGLADLHIHAPQFAYRGTGMDFELLTWLDRVTFPEEVRYADEAYADRAYRLFAEALRKSATTRAVIFGTIHVEATLKLMDLMEATGLCTLVGKVSMDRNAPPALSESDGGAAARRFVEAALSRGYRRTRPIVTPRFVPSCSDGLMSALGSLRREYGLPVQSHLSENPNEVALVARLVPGARFYGDAYDRCGLFGGCDAPAVMAHCIYSTEAEIERIRQNGVYIAHCPASNMNLASGIAPIRRYMSMGLRVGLGTDVAAGASASMFRAVTDAIQVSKLYWRLVDPDAKPLAFSEAFHLATRGGGALFGNVGAFEPGFALDALVLDDAVAPTPRPLPPADRLERAFYLGLDRGGIVQKYVEGKRLM